jgi:hypothetical protein
MRAFLLLAYGAAMFLHGNYHGNLLVSVTLSLTYTTSLIPYTNVQLFTFMMAAPVMFLTDAMMRKWRTSGEVFHARPEDNAEYVVGVAWGVTRVALPAAVISLCIAATVNLFASNFPFDGGVYLFYLAALFVPSLVFITGVALFTGSVIRHRGAGAMVLLGVIALSFFPRGEGVDPFGLTLPAAFSDVTGLAGMGAFLARRAGWLVAGMGLMVLAIASLERIPNSPGTPRRARALGWALLVAGGACFATIAAREAGVSRERGELAATYARYRLAPRLSVLSHAVRCAPEGGRLRARSVMVVTNRGKGGVERPLFFLNPALRVTSARVEGEEVSFERDHQALLLHREVAAGDTARVEVVYAGGVDASACYLEIPEARRCPMLSRVIGDCRAGEVHAFLERGFTLLTPECLWYPVALPPVNPGDVFDLEREFSEFALEVVTGEGEVAVSQGERVVSGDTAVFRNDRPLAGISLCVGPYASYQLTAGGVEYELLLFRGHEGLLDGLELVREKGEEIVQRVMGQLDDAPYPFRRLRVVECPLSFAAPYRVHRGHSEFVQPELLFLPERLNAMHGANFRGLLEYVRRDKMFDQLKDKSDAEIMEMEAEAFVEDNFKEEFTVRMTGQALFPVRRASKMNPLNTAALFHQHAWGVQSGEVPAVDPLFHLMMQDVGVQFYREVYGQSGMVVLPSVGGMERVSLRAYSNDPKHSPEEVHAAWRNKAREMRARAAEGMTWEEFRRRVDDFAREHPGSLALDELQRALPGWKGIDPSWYGNERLPAFVVRDLSTGMVEDDSGQTLPLRRVHFRVFNDGDAEGVISVVVNPFNPREGSTIRDYVIPPGEGREVSFAETDASFFLRADVSRNVPRIRSFVRNIQPVPPSRDTASRVTPVDPAYFLPAEGEIIVDNGDEGFRTVDASRRLFSFGARREVLYNYYPDNLSTEKWRAFIMPEGFGRHVLTAVVKRAGSGKARAEWTAAIDKAGEYEVFAYICPVFNGSRDVSTCRQRYSVAHADGAEEVSVDYRYVPFSNGEWFSLGRFSLPRGECRVMLSDQGDANTPLIYADAVKWTPVATGR